MALLQTMLGVEPRYVVGNNIRAARKRQDLTQEALAHKAGMHPVEMGRAERGTRDLRISTLVKIARGLGVEAAELLRDVT